MRPPLRSLSHLGAARLQRAGRLASHFLLSGLIIAAGPIVSACAQAVPLERNASADPHAVHIAEASQRFGIPVAWIKAIMRVESAGNARAISPKGAIGLMQIMPETWAELRIRHRLGSDPYDPRDNILAGAAYLREMRDRYGSPGFLAAYNAGPGRYEEHLAGRALPAETRAYVAKLLPFFGGGELTTPNVIAAADPRAWVRAPLFVAQLKRSLAADPAQRDGTPGGGPTATVVRDISAIVPHTAGLFIARTQAGALR